MTEYWGTIGNSKNFSVGPEDTREALIELLNHECPPGQNFRTGVRRDVNIVSLILDADYIVERILDKLYEEVGEIAEDWNPSYEAVEDLNSRFKIVFEDWIKVWGLQPTFFAVDQIQEHIANGD